MTIDDNPIMDEMNPTYRHDLESMPEIEKQRLRYGNWLVRPEGSGYFKRDWCEIVPQAPKHAVRVRCWDLASTLPSDINPNPDYTAGIRMSKDRDGIYYIEHLDRFRDRPAGVKQKLVENMRYDGTDVTVGIPKDPAAAGKVAAMDYGKAILENGGVFKLMPTAQNKVTRFAPFSAAAEAGMVKVVMGSWNEDFFKELEAFCGDGKGFDDIVDATADSFNLLAVKKAVPTNLNLSNLTMPNMFKGF